MGVYADAVNVIYDQLKLAQATGQPLGYVKYVRMGEQEAVTSLARPHIVVKLDDPAVEEEWRAANNIRSGAFIVLIQMLTTAGDAERPYGVTGDANKRGIVTLFEDVMNVVDLARAAILAANPTKLVDINVTMRQPRIVGPDSWEATAVVQITPRFTAGDR